MRGETPQHRPRALLTMFDMNMENMMKDMPDMDMSSASAMTSGWAQAGTPAGDKALDYKELRALVPQKDTRPPGRTLELHLNGNMERYIWTINGKKFDEAEPLALTYGERVRLRFINDSMMAHPMHLHGMFMQLENGQPAAKMPSKHTVIVPPGQTVSVLLTADEPGEWPFHCHLLYHMLSGMMTSAVVGKPGEPPATVEGGHHHAH
jgi:FtsP/CotA-like multicopper oxidase with cupredoxin domain